MEAFLRNQSKPKENNFVINIKKGIGLLGTAVLLSIVWGPSSPIDPLPRPPINKLNSHAQEGAGLTMATKSSKMDEIGRLCLVSAPLQDTLNT